MTSNIHLTQVLNFLRKSSGKNKRTNMNPLDLIMQNVFQVNGSLEYRLFMLDRMVQVLKRHSRSEKPSWSDLDPVKVSPNPEYHAVDQYIESLLADRGLLHRVSSSNHFIPVGVLTVPLASGRDHMTSVDDLLTITGPSDILAFLSSVVEFSSGFIDVYSKSYSSMQSTSPNTVYQPGYMPETTGFDALVSSVGDRTRGQTSGAFSRIILEEYLGYPFDPKFRNPHACNAALDEFVGALEEFNKIYFMPKSIGRSTGTGGVELDSTQPPVQPPSELITKYQPFTQSVLANFIAENGEPTDTGYCTFTPEALFKFRSGVRDQWSVASFETLHHLLTTITGKQ